MSHKHLPGYMRSTNASVIRDSITSEETRKRTGSSRLTNVAGEIGKSHGYPQYKSSFTYNPNPHSGAVKVKLSAQGSSVKSERTRPNIDVHVEIPLFGQLGVLREPTRRTEDDSIIHRSTRASHHFSDNPRHHGSHYHDSHNRRPTSDHYHSGHSASHNKHGGSDGIYPSSRRHGQHSPRGATHHVPTTGLYSGDTDYHESRCKALNNLLNSELGIDTRAMGHSSYDNTCTSRYDSPDNTYNKYGQHNHRRSHSYEWKDWEDSLASDKPAPRDIDVSDRSYPPAAWTYETDTDDTGFARETNHGSSYNFRHDNAHVSNIMSSLPTSRGVTRDTHLGASGINRHYGASETYGTSHLTADKTNTDPGLFKPRANTVEESVWKKYDLTTDKASAEYGSFKSRDDTVGESVWKKYGDERPTPYDCSTREWSSSQNRERNDQQHKLDNDVKASPFGKLDRAAGLDKDYTESQKGTYKDSSVGKIRATEDQAQRPSDRENIGRVDKVRATDGQDQRHPDKDKTAPNDKIKVVDRPDERQKPMKGNAGPVDKVAATKEDKWSGARPKEKNAKFKPEVDRDEAPYAKYDHRPREWERDKAIDKKSLNLEFYKNEMKSKPWGCKIEEMLKWKGDYHKLESNHSYIQWLFPTQEYSNFNSYVQPIEFHEAEEIRASPEMQRRFLQAYRMMLDFYGMELVSEETGEVKTSKNWKDRFRHLNRSTHNFYRITRILIALGIFGYEHFQTPWLMFMMEQKFVHRTLPDIPFGVMHHWIGSVNNDTSREHIVIQFKEFSDKWDAQGHNPRRGSRRSQALVPSQEEKLAEKIGNLHTAQKSEDEKLDDKVSSLREKQGKGNAIEMSEFKAGERGLHVDDVNVGLDCDDNEKLLGAGKVEPMDTSEAIVDRPRAVSGRSGDAKNIDRDAHAQAPADKPMPTMPNVKDDRNNSIKASGQSLSGSGATFTSNKAPEPDLGVEQFGTSTRSANNSSYNASAIGGDGEQVLHKPLTGTQGALSQSVRGQSDHSKRAQAQFDRSLSCPGENDGDNYEYAGHHSNDDELANDNLNLKFYRNEMVSKPVGRQIEEILKMEGDHNAIEDNPAFFQWLFPTQQRSRSNRFAQPLQVHEAEAIRDSPELKGRFLRAYKMILDFYGMELASEETGEVQRNPRTCRERLIYLNRSPTDHPRITRILTSLGILGFKHYQLPWLRFLMRESLREGTLAAIPAEVLQQHWVSALSSDEDQTNAVIYSTTLQEEKK